ncbi:peptide antibiotic transporter SbmA [Aestuariivirga litoralis]|uniref:Peptide antibiotic transporter SbmA n=1 Tax=Aestuariivirga litoralis TaxID=2650924 RepID=A0A2W2AUV6_9HYPH|nr:peptide antibiotic transporter SbmA [Aestuariivirga litoralis]PZF76400.1 peptide antibiotic transporter SbmA [Aestuariivirga litoralis]
MFVSFFPSPRLFFSSAILWSLVAVLIWFFLARDAGGLIGLPNPPADAPPILGVTRFVSPPFLWFYLFFGSAVALFATVWRVLDPHPYFRWSVLGSALIIFVLYFMVEVSVTINDWYGSYFDLIQKALDPSTKGTVPAADLYVGLAEITSVLLLYIIVAVLNAFFTSHYVFRWRTAMNDHYAENWSLLRGIEGAAQRVQEDTMRFARTFEDLGTSLVSAIMTLIAFLPILAALSSKIPAIPILGSMPYSLVIVSLVWSLFGTGILAIVGIKLPGLEFRNQRVEAAYRKELVYGEDDPARATPRTLRELFDAVRQNYFRLYFNYLYFNVVRYAYLQADLMLPFFVLIPSIAAGAITFGIFQQVRASFGEVRDAMQYLVKSWPDIVEFMSIYKRLRAFEAALHGETLPDIDRKFIEDGQLV